MKAIELKVKLIGQGIVNFDSNEQSYLWNKQNSVERVNKDHKNVSFGKGRYYEVEDGDNVLVKKVPVISADCFRHYVFLEQSVHMPNIMHDEMLLLKAQATKTLLQRGYLFAKGNGTYKRTSPFKTSPAYGVSYGLSQIETYSNRQERNNIEKDDSKSETSFFKKEVRGDIKYELRAWIDLQELQFISLSDIHDRLSIDPDNVDIYREFLSETLKSEVPPAKYFKKNGDVYADIPEYGIKLTNEQTLDLARDLIEKIIRFNIVRTTSGWVQTETVEARIINDVLSDVNKEFTVIYDGKTFKDIISGEILSCYTETSLEEAKKTIEEYKDKFGSKQNTNVDESNKQSRRAKNKTDTKKS